MTCCINIQKLLYRQSYSKIFVWWFRYDLFQLTKEMKAVQNDEIKIIIADHTHMHGLKFERCTIDTVVQNEFSLNVKSEKTFEWARIFPYKRSHQLCFSNRDQILATPKSIVRTAPRGGFWSSSPGAWGILGWVFFILQLIFLTLPWLYSRIL